MITIPSRDLETTTRNLGLKIFDQSERRSSRFFSGLFWVRKFLELSFRYPKLKLELFRFVDVLPSLRSNREITEHFVLYLLSEDSGIPAWIRKTLRFYASLFPISVLFGGFVRFAVGRASGNFIAGRDLKTADANLKRIRAKGNVFTLDVLGEAALSEKEAVAYQKQYLELLRNIGRFSGSETTGYGRSPFVNVSVKCSSLYSQISSLAKEESISALKERLRPILRTAKENGYFANLDAEQSDYKDVLLTLAEEIFSEPDFADYPHFGVVIQTYLRESENDLKRILEYSKNRKTPITVRLVKGAYWEYEVIRARERGWEIPVYENKRETDANYERCGRLLMDSFPRVLSAFASHNVRSLAYLLSYAESKGLSKRDFEIQMLYGMADSYKIVFSSMGYRVREYTPLGLMLPGMAYLVRRLLENTSNQGFLQNLITGRTNFETLLSDPGGSNE